jgi:hypothetical protein
VPLENLKTDRVTSWRVQLLHQGVMLDQKLSASWR